MRVWPRDETARKILRHPHGNIGFHEQGWIEWPDDTWTHRRIADGDVTTEAPAETPAEAPAEKKSKSSKSE